MIFDLVVIGGGAGGFFGAIRVGELFPGAKICILEAARKPLSKVEISGGGRCNVTHACFDPEELTSFYPRGQKEMLGPFFKFQPKDMVEWLQSRGVKLKKENDGRMFPVTDKSSTIIDCFTRAIERSGIKLLISTRASDWVFDESTASWKITLFDGNTLQSKFLLIASGSDQRTWDLLKKIGHTIISPVPSLFTFNIRDTNLLSLQGISKSDVKVSIPAFKLETSGPLLITHWGVSGPAILKLSAWGARDLYDCGYVFDLVINWRGAEDQDMFRKWLQSTMKINTRRKVNNLVVQDIPARLWKYFCTRAEIPELTNCSEMGNKHLDRLADVLCRDTYRVTGKSTYKDEFVTAGGVDLTDIDMKSFQSKIRPQLFLVGEVLNIDALTGGFNFQAAWTGAELAARKMSELLRSN
ncbi:MAG: aminoacetone oxidase family FAD-binding enzyme [Saprospiraceae bacterium]|uniref:Aminoacetone oxidase family FAD-binding enzyme n=1 Tax=Candidatus Opimibacter skivensis TaxID=2982028 RepID=A0A9D7XRR4_9BACT|nr:aminoacetone oxidase family FAD-binding enzyme [Candidatus Opimibacter skivensis]